MGGVQEILYLIGTFGIPLFLLVNGWLNGYKDFTLNFLIKVTLRFLRFILIWTIIVSIPFLNRGFSVFLDTFSGALKGEGILYHFWFLSGLLVIYVIVFFLNFFIKFFADKEFNEIAERKSFLVALIVLMTASFIISVVLKIRLGIEINSIIIGPFRIITNLGYFSIGVYLRRNFNSISNYKQRINHVFCFTAIVFCFVLLCVTSYFTKLIWASSFYSFIAVIAATTVFAFYSIHIFRPIPVLSEQIVRTSSAMWVLHPFVIKCINKSWLLVFGEINVLARLISVIVCVFICTVIGVVANKNKYLSFLVNI